jgi:hypothetical protein
MKGQKITLEGSKASNSLLLQEHSASQTFKNQTSRVFLKFKGQNGLQRAWEWAIYRVEKL